LEKLAKIVGVESIKLNDMSSVYHALKADLVHHKMHHDVPKELKKELIELKDWVLGKKYYNREMGKLGAGLLLSHVANEMKNFTSGAKFNYYSAHDGTMLALLAALGLENYQIPRYASYIVFELYENSEGTHVELTYNGNPLYSECESKCHFNTFNKLILDGLSDYEYFLNVCGSEPDSNSQKKTKCKIRLWYPCFLGRCCCCCWVVYFFPFPK